MKILQHSGTLQEESLVVVVVPRPWGAVSATGDAVNEGVPALVRRVCTGVADDA